MKFDSKFIDGRASRRLGAFALLACAATLPIAATTPVSAETAGQISFQAVTVPMTAGVAQPPAEADAPVATPPSEVEPDAPAQTETASTVATDLSHPSLDGPPTRERVFEAICAAGIKHPQIVMRQAILETGNLRHGMLMSRNNLFGFRSRAYLRFDKWQDSVAYYKRWQDRHYPDSSENYSRFLDRIRYASPGYPAHVMRISWERSCPS